MALCENKMAPAVRKHPEAVAKAQRRGPDMSEPNPYPIDRHTLERAKRESLRRLHSARETLASQLHAASWHVQESALLTREGLLPDACFQATRAAQLCFAATEGQEPVRPWLELLGVPLVTEPADYLYLDREAAGLVRESIACIIDQAKRDGMPADMVNALLELQRAIGGRCERAQARDR